MKLQESLNLINIFFGEQLPFGNCTGETTLKILESESDLILPFEVKEYIEKFAPEAHHYFNGVGNPLEILGRKQLSWKMNGYNYNLETNKAISGWDKNWFLIANEGGDPIIVNMSEQDIISKVYMAMHGAGSWNFEPISDSIAQFLVCAAAMHHALYGFDLENSVTDDEKGFNLVAEPAEWLFPFMEQHAKGYYENWVSVFDNC